jgi:anti-anti-sigma factor
MGDGEISSGPGTVVVALPAEIDYGNWEEVRSRLLGALRPDAVAVVIDLTSTVFCDSAGLASLARACRAAADRNITLRAAVSSALVLRLFR